MSSSKSLLDMPDVVMHKIFDKIGVRGVLTLQKVCHSLREYIDSQNMSMDFKAISVTMSPTKIWVTIGGQEGEILYQNVSKGCEVVYNGKVKNLHEADFVSVFIHDLRSILIFQKTPLQRLNITFDEYEPGYSVECIEEVYKQLKTLLESSKRPIPVEKFVMNALKQKHVMSFLPFLDSKFLKEIRILDPTLWGIGYEPLYIDKIVKLEQWKGAEKVFIEIPIKSSTIPYFKDFKCAVFSVYNIYENGLNLLETAFQQSKTLEWLQIKYSYDSYIEEALSHFFGPSFQNDDEEHWFTRIPESDLIMRVVSNPDEENLIFSRINESDVPEGAVIRKFIP
uniref:F-box domain-containing protein n=1 Tax=Caenorhabditis tropicalis TaxID=1561998 RepID=A0A1I7ULH8_9PELO